MDPQHFPRLKVIVPHLGGAMPFLAGSDGSHVESLSEPIPRGRPFSVGAAKREDAAHVVRLRVLLG